MLFCVSCTMWIRFLHYLRFDLNENYVYAWWVINDRIFIFGWTVPLWSHFWQCINSHSVFAGIFNQFISIFIPNGPTEYKRVLEFVSINVSSFLPYGNSYMYTTFQKLCLCSAKLNFIDQKYSKISNIVKYYYNKKQFSVLIYFKM